MKEHFAKLPPVNRLLEILADETSRIDPLYIKNIVTDILNQIKKNSNSNLLKKKTRKQLEEYIALLARDSIENLLAPALKRVVNATGIVLHTGLGRAPLGKDLINEVHPLEYYSNLEIDLSSGNRGERINHVSTLLKMLTGAEAAAVVNNNAAAVLLSLHALARRKEVIISRGELVEIGGSFRMPEVMQISLAKMVEVGATNKTHIEDYASAISARTAAIMLAHTSNFEIIGFTHKPPLTEIIDIAHKNDFPVIYDLGSGALLDMQNFNLGDEPVVREIVAAGVDVVTFSGDKLLGGPQSGIIVGKERYISKIRRDHLLRALRCDKITLSLLNSTLRNYLRPENLTQKNSTLQLFSRSKTELNKLANALVSKLDDRLKNAVHIVAAEGKAGSGAFPVLNIPTIALEINHPDISANRLAKSLRQNPIPVIGTIAHDRFILNFLAIFENDIDIIATALNELK